MFTERFREWMALRVLKPLAAALDDAHADANRLLAPFSADRLPPLDDAVAGGGGGGGGGGANSSGANGGGGGAVGTQAGAGGGGAGTGGVGSGAGVGGAGVGAAGATAAAASAAAAGDADAAVAQLMAMAEAGARGAPPAQQQQLAELYGALHRYQQLLLLLRGRRPAELLPPAPASHVAAAVRRLARGTCLGDFCWNGGGPGWSPDLPTDSALVFYLFAAFLDAPGWRFPLQPAPEGGRGAPLYLGALRSRPPARYSALLAFRPDKMGPGAAAVIGSNLSSREPRYSWVAEGQMVTFEQRDGVFHSLLLFLSHHAARRQGLLGGRYLNELDGLDAVLRAAPAPTVPQRVWGYFFPAVGR